jgi:hypothetical protein
MDLLRCDILVGLLISYKNKEKWQMLATFLDIQLYKVYFCLFFASTLSVA